MGLEKKKNYKNKAAVPRAIPENAIEPLISPVIIPEQIFRSLLNYFIHVAPDHRNVALSVKEYPVENINDRVGRTKSDPTHLVVFSVRIIASEKYNVLGVVHMNKRFVHVDQLTLLWVAFVQDLSRLGLNVVASVSPCTQMYRDILSQLTRNKNFENWSQPITYPIYPYSILHLYDFNSIMEEFQDAFYFRKDLCFITRHWAGSSGEKIYAASWRNLYGVVKPTFNKPSYNYSHRSVGGAELIFMPTFRRNYEKASQNNPSSSFMKLSTDFLLNLLWEFSKIRDKELMNLDELETFCVENQELKYMLASAHFKSSPYNEVQKENVWFRIFESNGVANKDFESNAILEKRSHHIESDGDVIDRGKEALQTYINRIAFNETPFFDVEDITSMNKGSTLISKSDKAFMESKKNKKHKSIEDTPNSINKTDSINPRASLSSNEALQTKKRVAAPKKIENQNEDVMGTSRQTFNESDIEGLHYLDHILKSSKQDLKNYLDIFGYSRESYNDLYAYEQANTQSGKISKHSQHDDISKETEGDTSDQKRKLYSPYRKPGKFPKNPNHPVPVEYPSTDSNMSKKRVSNETASAMTLDKNVTEIQCQKLKNGQKSACKEPAGSCSAIIDFTKCSLKTKVSKEDQEIPISTFYKNALREYMTEQLKNSNNCGKIVSEQSAKQQRNGAHVDSLRGGDMFKNNNVDSKDMVSNCLSTVDENARGKSIKMESKLPENKNHKVPVESARNGSKMSKDNNMNFKELVSYEPVSEATVIKNATKNAKEIPIIIISQKDFVKTFSDFLGGETDDAEKTEFLTKPISKSKVDSNATKATTKIKNSAKATEKQKSSEMPNKAKPKSMNLQGQMKNECQISASKTSIDHAFMSSDQQLLSSDQAVELIKSKQEALEHIGFDSCLPIDTLSQENKIGKSETLKPSFSGKRSKVFVRDYSCGDEISPVTLNAVETTKIEPKPDSTKEQKTAYSYVLPGLVKNSNIEQTEHSTTETKNEIQSHGSDNCQEVTESENLIYDLYTKDSMDNFFKCFIPKRNHQLNKVSFSFLQNISLSSPYILESASEDEFEDPVEEEDIFSGTFLNNEESPQQHAGNYKVKVIDLEEYRQLLLSDCDKQKRTCDIINVKDAEVVMKFFNILPENAEVLQITTDWLCTLKGYSKFVHILRGCNVPLVRTSALCLDHIDLFVDIIRERNSNRLLFQAHKLSYKELRFTMIDREGTFQVLEREGRGSGRFEIIQDCGRSV